MKITQLFKSLFKTPKHGLPDMEVSTPMPEVKPCKGDNISEPVYTIVQKIKDDPSRIKFTEGLVNVYKDKYSSLSGELICYMDVQVLIFNNFNLTKEEEAFIVKELKPVLKEYNNGRKQRLDNIRRQRLLRQWEK